MPSTIVTSDARCVDVFVTSILYVRSEPGVTGSGPEPASSVGLSVRLIANGAVDADVTTWVLTSADVLFNSLLSAIVFSGSTTAVLVIATFGRR